MKMTIATLLGLLLLGVAAGMLSSMVGIGGGILIVPVLVYFFAMSQKSAQGTSLALLLPPVGIFAVINYYKAGFVDLKVAGVLIVAFVAGSFLGSKIVLDLPDNIIKKLFGVFLLLVSLKYLFFDK
ncbi:MAG: sulfite exporter TauE/SafE family protein [Chitinophagaceae bacterium]|nr:sulfite exporter TauE/SafE family protein [Chitinophagaceae bacterium]